MLDLVNNPFGNHLTLAHCSLVGMSNMQINPPSNLHIWFNHIESGYELY